MAGRFRGLLGLLGFLGIFLGIVFCAFGFLFDESGVAFAFGFEDVGDDFIGGGKIVGLDGFIEVGDEAEEFIDGGLVIGEKLWTIFGGDFVDGFGGFGASGGGRLFHFGDEGEGGVFLGGIGELFLDGFEGFTDGLHAVFEWGVVGAESGDGEDGEEKKGEDFHLDKIKLRVRGEGNQLKWRESSGVLLR